MSQLIRHFIRESLRSRIDEVGELFGGQGATFPTGRGPAGSYAASRLKDDKVANLTERSLLGYRFSSARDGKPEISIVGDNKQTDEVLAIPYPISGIDDDRSSGTTTPLEEMLIRKFRARMLPMNDALINSIKNQQRGWEYASESDDFLDKQMSAADIQGLDFVPNYFLIPRKIGELLKAPAKSTTRAAAEKAARFECADLSVSDLISTIMYKDVTDPDWSLAAACFYDLANEPNWTAAIAAGAVSALLASETGPGAIVAFFLGAGLAMTVSDVVYRIPVIYWAYANKKWKFLSANVVYTVILIGFESWAHFKEAKILYTSAKITGDDTAIKTAPLLYKKIIDRLGPTGRLNVADDALRGAAPKVAAEMLEAGLRGKLPDEELAIAKRAAASLDFWTPIKIIVVQISLQIIAYLFGEEAKQSCAAEVIDMTDADSLTDYLTGSKSELKKFIEEKYPPI